MTFQQKMMAMTAVASGIAMAILPRTAVAVPPGVRAALRPERLVAVCLVIVAGALLVVGIVSNTPIRHAIQIAPFVVAVVLMPRRPAWIASAAAPLFAFWFLLMGAVWLFLLGVARIVTGTFTAVEVALTVIIGAASVVGLGAGRRAPAIPPAARLGLVAAFAILQLSAMLMSVLPSFARR